MLKQSALFFRGCFIILGDMLHQVVAQMHIHWKKCCFASCRSQFRWAGPPTSSPSSVAWYIPSSTLRTVAGCCGEDMAWVEWWCDHSAPSELVQDFANGAEWVVDP